VKKLGAMRNDTLERRERDYLAALKDTPAAGDVEIFEPVR